MALLAGLPTTSERFQLELNLQVTLGPALMAMQGSATPEVEQAYERARALCRQVGETPQLGPVLWGMWRYYQARGTLQTSHELGEHLLTLAQHQSHPSLLLAAYQALGQTSYLLGEFSTAREYLEQALGQGPAFAEIQHHRAMAVRYGVAPGVYGLTFAALTLWSLGYADQAVQHSQAALALAQQLSHPQSLAVAQYYAGQLHVHRGEAAVIQEHAEALMSLATAQEFSHYVTLATFLRGAALMAQGKHDAGVTTIRQGMAAALASGAELFWPYWLILLAEGYGKVGQPDMGLAVLTQAAAVVEKTEERFYASELPRIQGELLLQQEPPDIKQAETSLQQALAIARSQQAKAWELRAVTALSRLWQREGKGNDALRLLQDAMGWFTEGSTTADPQEAQALLTQFT